MITITRGKDKEFFLNLKSKKTKLPFDLTELVTLKIRFLKDDGTTFDLTYPGGGITVINVGGGRVKCELEVADTGTIKKIGASTMEVEYELGLAPADDSSNFKDTIYIANAYQVIASKFA